MPAVFLDRLPLPSLRAYTAVSVALLSCSLYYAIQVTSQSDWKKNATVSFGFSLEPNDTNTSLPTYPILNEITIDNVIITRFLEVLYFLLQEPLCVWTLINIAYCCLILFGKLIQKIVFGELRVSEQQHIKDKFWNFVFYKFIFIFGVMNVQFMDEVVLWCSWFTVLGFLHLLAQLCKDRFEYLSFSPTTPKWTHIRVVSLLLGILLLSFGLFGICILVGLHAGVTTFFFMAAECALVTVRTLYVIVRYAIHLWDINHEGVWENRTSYIYYSEFMFEITALAIDFVHHVHMLWWGNIFLSMASLVIGMQLRYLFHEMQRRIRKHKNYLQVVRHMEANYPMATAEEIEKNSDDCAICWDRIEGARKLPCGHLFHNSCLRSWLEQDTSCPTCRMTLSHRMGVDPRNTSDADTRNNLMGPLGIADDRQGQTPINQMTNHFFHFDGSRYVSWLPSFSVEVTHPNLLGERETRVQTSQLDSMAHQVHQMFPHIPLALIRDDLRVTRSIELTVENILDERLIAPPSAMFQVAPLRSHSNIQLNDSPLGVGNLQSTSDVPSSSNAPEEEPAASFPLEDLDTDDARSDEMCPGPDGHGSRFSKSSEERERMLARRKDELLKLARKRYLSRLQKDNASCQSSSSSSDDASSKPSHCGSEGCEEQR